jgi:hypothetical protein
MGVKYGHLLCGINVNNNYMKTKAHKNIWI